MRIDVYLTGVCALVCEFPGGNCLQHFTNASNLYIVCSAHTKKNKELSNQQCTSDVLSCSEKETETHREVAYHQSFIVMCIGFHMPEMGMSYVSNNARPAVEGLTDMGK